MGDALRTLIVALANFPREPNAIMPAAVIKTFIFVRNFYNFIFLTIIL